jgi:cbb3-type cytochrome c oxidase subunit III
MIRTLTIAVSAVVVALVLVVAWTIYRADGFSTRAEPSWAERSVARLARRWSVPARAREARNPVVFSDEVWREARAHFADHCASCHANNGSGQTEIGRNLYPRAPDMRLPETQDLSDGELYWIIENGVRLTGMPAWGDGTDHDTDTWKLVHLVRNLSRLTPEHLREMEANNPKSPADLAEEHADDRFLEGQDHESPPGQPPHHQHKEQP